MPKLVRLYIVNVAIGFALAFAFVSAIVWLDVGGLRHLVTGTEMGWLAFFMMVVFNGMTGGYIENELSILWSSVELLTIQSGDVYKGAGGLILVVAATILLVLRSQVV